MAEKQKLNHNDMLMAEFEYIANTAFQANEDRSRVTSFYFVSVGSLVAAILSTQFGELRSRTASLAFFLLFSVLTAMGALTIAQLARLRAAWHESLEAMNQIKDFYIKDNPQIAKAFKWRVRSIPPTSKPLSIANLIAIEVAFLGALTTGAAAYFLMAAIGEIDLLAWVISAAGVIAGFFGHWAWYKRLLVDDH